MCEFRLLHRQVRPILRVLTLIVDAAVVLLSPSVFDGTEYSTGLPGSLRLSDFATPDEVKQIGIGEPIISAGLVPGLSGEKRNYPFFKFGNISSIPEEPVWMSCEPGKPQLSLVKVWFVAANLIPGNSGSPIFYAPPGPLLVSGAVSRPVVLGLQSNSLVAADLAGMTPIDYVYQIIEALKLADANLTRGAPQATKH